MHDIHDFEVILRSRTPLIVLETHEELKALELLKFAAQRANLPLHRWTITEGLIQMNQPFEVGGDLLSPLEMLSRLKQQPQRGIYTLVDFHPYFDNPAHVRLVKEIALRYSAVPQTIVFLSHKLEPPAELRGLTARFEPSLPGKERLDAIVKEVAAQWSKDNLGKKVKTSPEALELLMRNLSGLTETDARRIVQKAIYDDGKISEDDADVAITSRFELLQNAGALTLEHDETTFEDIAGFTNLRKWIEQRSAVFSNARKLWKLDAPRGVLLLGVQGCGKSAAAKAIAGQWKVPLLRLDFGAVYNKFIGESERILRESLKGAESLAPCVMWIDEIEKAISGGESDSGTSRRVLGQLLTWLAEKKKEVFLVATANDISSLPPELIRKGRFDEIFFVDLPALEDRRRILEIHLNRRSLKPENFSIDSIAAATDGFSGAELEQVVVSALYGALAKKEMVSSAHLQAEVEATRPLSVIMAEKIAELRAWAADRTIAA